MALSYQKIAGHSSINDGIQIARDGDIKLYYIDQPIDLLREHDQDTAMYMVSDIVDDVVKDMMIFGLGTGKLNTIDCDIMSKSCPTNRIQRRIFNDVKNRIAAMESKIYYPQNGNISILPRKLEGQNNRIYVSGSSGSGKSFWRSRYALNYLSEYPNNRIFLFSRKTFDPVFDDVISNIIRVPLDRKFVMDVEQNPEFISNFHDSLLIFDDFEGIHDKDIKRSIMQFKDSAFQLGRQYNIDIISVQHKSLGGAKSIVDLCESNILVCFPKMNLGECLRMINKYCSYSKDQMERIFDDDMKRERWLCIIRPNIAITEHFIKIID